MNLDRFLSAQNNDNTFDEARHELRTGAKTSHWIWFIFPQIHSLGSSSMCKRFAINDLDEAVSYLAHPVLSSRLIQITIDAVNALPRFEISLEQLLGSIDAVKFRSSMTLFLAASRQDPMSQFIFANALVRACNGECCHATRKILNLNEPPTDDDKVASIKKFQSLLSLPIESPFINDPTKQYAHFSPTTAYTTYPNG